MRGLFRLMGNQLLYVYATRTFARARVILRLSARIKKRIAVKEVSIEILVCFTMIAFPRLGPGCNFERIEIFIARRIFRRERIFITRDLYNHHLRHYLLYQILAAPRWRLNFSNTPDQLSLPSPKTALSTSAGQQQLANCSSP